MTTWFRSHFSDITAPSV